MGRVGSENAQKGRMRQLGQPLRISLLAATLAFSGIGAAGDSTTGDLRCELVVIGGGSGGFGAALAAARLGVDVVLVERADCLGGNSVRGGVNCWEMGAGGTGIPFDLYCRLKRQANAIGIYSFGRHGMWFDPQRDPYRYPGGETIIDPARRYLDTLQRHGTKGLGAGAVLARKLWHGLPFEPDAMAKTMLAMLEETGHCHVLLNATFQGANGDEQFVASVTLADGRRIRADYFVDATGDGTVCVSGGCATMMGQESRDTFGEPSAPTNSTSRVNGVSLIYRATPVPKPAIEPLPEGVTNRCWWAGRFPSAHVNHYPNGDLNINMLPTMDGAEFLRRGYADAMEECQRRIRAHWHYMQSGFSEFQNYRLSWVAPALGIRESRRIVGEYVLTEHDLLAGISGQKHPDTICIVDHPMDTHGGQSRGMGELREPYGVPYRCLIPKGRRNLLIACRAASFSSLAASSCRLSRTMMQLGQAAGTAVALAKQLKVDLPDVPAARLRDALREQHVQLEHPMSASLRAHLADEDTAGGEPPPGSPPRDASAKSSGPAREAERPPRNLLLADEGNKTLMKIRPGGDPAWVLPIPANHRTLQLAGTNTLVCSTGNGFWEVNVTSGEVIRKVEGFGGVTSAVRMEDGSTVLACGGALCRVAPDGSGSAAVKLEKPVFRVMNRTSEGTWLYGSGDSVVEADDSGKVLWCAKVEGKRCGIYEARRGADGTVWATTGYDAALVQIDRGGRILQRITGPAEVVPNFYAGFRFLDSGNILLTNWQGHGLGNGAKGVQLIEYDPQGRVAWRWQQDPRFVSSLHTVLPLGE